MTKIISLTKVPENTATELSEQLTPLSIEQENAISKQADMVHPLAHFVDRYDGELWDELLQALEQNRREEEAVARRNP